MASPPSPPPPAQEPEYVPAGFFVFRTPLLPFEELEAWSAGLAAYAAPPEDLERALAADRERLRERLRELAGRPEILEALFLASPSLHEGLATWQRDPDGKKGQRAERALVRYLFRMAARATPFGLFSGCSLGTVDPTPGAPTRLTLGPRAAYGRHTRLDMDYLFALCEDLGRDPALRAELLYRPNSSLYRAAGRLRYAEARLVDKVRSHHLVAVEGTEYLEAALARAGGGARIADLTATLVAADPDGEITAEDAAAYVGELIDSQILVSELSPPVTGPEAVHDLIERLAGLPTDAGERLAWARDALAGLDAAGAGQPPERYREIARRLADLPTPVELARLFQLDMVKPAAAPALGPAVLAEVERGVTLLRRIAGRRADLFEKFRKDFSDRYGEEREVPLVEVLDEEIGIGFEKSGDAGAEASPLLQGLAIGAAATDSTVPWTPRETHLLTLFANALAAGRREIDLSAQDVDRLAPPPASTSPGETAELPPLADAFQVMATIAAPSQEALDAGDFRVLFGGAVGPSGARLLGRFCHADPEIARQVAEHLRAEEALAPGALFAEIVHLPQGRIGNILSRPVLRGWEIPFLGRSGAPPERQIPVTDLVVTVRGAQVVLRSRRLGREVVPRLTSAHNYRLGSLGIYRFLCMLQMQGVQGGVGWSWGPLENAPFVPRVTAGRLVLARAAWWMTQEEIKALAAARGAARFAAVRDWRERRGLPRLAALADGDNELLVDFANVLSVDTFLDVIEERDRARLLEVFPGPDELCARGPEGRFVHELVIPYTAAAKRAAAAPIERPERPEPAAAVAVTAPAAAPAVRRSFPPGSEWLYVKLYTGTATADRVLREVVAPAAAAALAGGAADSWFFIRYGDPEWHLRVRFHGAPAALREHALPALAAAAAPLLDDGRLWRLQLDTYEREVERYGGAAGIELAERLFHADSEAVVALLDLLEGDEGADARWRLALCGIDRLLGDLRLDAGDGGAAAKLAVLTRLRRSFWREHKGDKALRVRLDRKLRGERRALEALLFGDRAGGPAAGGAAAAYAPALAVLDRRSAALAPIAAELAAREAAGRLSVPRAALAASLVHMHANRLLRSAARAHEMVLYDFLGELIESRAARCGVKRPS